MSKYIFIASDFELPEVNLTNEQIITPIEAKLRGIKPPCFLSWDEIDQNSEILYFESEEDMDNLCVRKEKEPLDDALFYSDKKYIYEVTLGLDNKRARQLLDYIKGINLVKPIEIYSIWLDDRVDLDFKSISIEVLNEDMILALIESYKSYMIIK